MIFTTATEFGLDWITDTSGLVRSALLIALISGIFALYCITHMMVLRWLRQRQMAREAAARARWREYLRGWIIDAESELTAPASWEMNVILQLWLQLQDTFAGDIRESLRDFASRIHLIGYIDKCLTSRNETLRLLGVIAAGHLKEATRMPLLEQALRTRDTLLALAAGRSMVQIDAQRALPAVVSELPLRPEWTANRVKAMLGDADPELVAQCLHGALLQSSDAELAMLLPAVSCAAPERIEPSLLTRLKTVEDPALLAESLACLSSPRGADFARNFLEHPVWFVRVRAIACITPLMTGDDRPRLQALTRDSNWWVANRARTALGNWAAP